MIGLLISITAAVLAPAAQTCSAQLSREEVERILFDFRPGVDWKVKEANVERLARTGEAYVPLLIKCLKWELPAWLTERIKKTREEGSPVARRSDSSSLGVQPCAEAALIKIGNAAVPLLTISLESQAETIERVARVLGEIGDKRAIPPLISVLKDAKWNWANRDSAARALEALGAQEAIPYLIESLRGQPDDPYNSDKLADSVANALAELTGCSFGFTLVVSQVDMAWNVVPRYAIKGTPQEREATIARWRQWWEQQNLLRGQIEHCLAGYAERLKNGDRQQIKAMRSADYIRRIKGRKGQLILCENLHSEWFDGIEQRKASLPGCRDYQISVANCRFEGERAIVTSRDKALIMDGVTAWFAVVVERALEKRGDSWVVSEENLLTWERPRYDG